MKEYKMIYLNKGLSLSREKDLQKAETLLNQCIKDGWELEQIISPADGAGALIALMSKENRYI